MPPPLDLKAAPKNKKIIFDDDEEKVQTENITQKVKKNKTKHPLDLNAAPKNKKIIFDDDEEKVQTENITQKIKKSEIKSFKNESGEDGQPDNAIDEEEDYFAKREKERKQAQNDSSDDPNVQQKWYNVYPQFNISEDALDMKDSEQIELFNLCKSSFEAEKSTFAKRNPSDSRWLQTALHKGTAKDRANAGALLVTSNPLGNVEALSTLINQTKISNKSSSDVIGILTDLWKEVLLPPHRKLISIQMRAADWKLLRKDTEISNEKQRKIYAYWYFENELKDQYFEFLKNLQQGIQTGQENNKNASIIAASILLAYAPEKEQMLLTMLINKLGDPLAKIASKALHHLTEVAHKHPNMCGVIVSETEKLLFRNNISDRAQHFALCFLSSIAPAGRSEVCTKLVHICFSLFKVLVQKGAVNNRTMQAILRCLQKAILEAKSADGSGEIINKDMQDTIYRLVHLADIRISVQTLSLLLQLITVKSEKSDRFYNALYKKMLDMEVTSIGTKTGAQFLHIIHRAIHIDSNIQRAQAFIKRVLQIALYMPPQMAAGCLIVINKLLRSRKELGDGSKLEDGKGNDVSGEAIKLPMLPKVLTDDEELAKFDSDGEEKYEDIVEDKQNSKEEDNKDEKKSLAPSSWHHAKVETTAAKISDISATKYDPYHRVPTYAGAEYALSNELLLLREHFHPTVQVFADNILNQKRIEYYGDPLRDFGLPHFLERFAFKNPKKLDQIKADIPILAHKRYVSFGTRGKPVKALTKTNCTEDEMFIFNYLEQKRKQAVLISNKKEADDDDDDLDLKPGEVNDDEFEDYLDGFFGKKSKAAADDEDLDFLKEIGGELKIDEKKTKNKKKQVIADHDSDADMEDVDADWGDQDEEKGSDVSDDEAGSIDLNDDDENNDSEGSISLDEAQQNNDNNEDDMSTEEDSDISNDDDDSDLDAPKSKKARKQSSTLDGRSFAQKLKHSDGDMSSLFAAADDFAELLEDTGKTKGQGTSNAIFNKDKSSDKQLKWEEIRRSNTKNYTKRSGGAKFSRNKNKPGKNFSKKRITK